MIFINLLFWGPLPAGWLWIGARVFYWTDNVGLGIFVSFIGLLLTLVAGLAVLKRIDHAWILVRRAAGRDQRKGIIGPIFATTAVIGGSAFTFWLLFIGGLGSSVMPGQGPERLVGLVGYYRQFQGLSDEEVSEELREVAAERRARALERVEPLDLSHTTWPELPPPTVVNAVTYMARRGMHRYIDPHAAELRGELATALAMPAEQVVVGNGAAQLLGAAVHALMEPGDELVTPWPSYPLYPLLARRARGSAVPVPGWGVEAILRAVNDRTRVVALCNPNDPTGEFMDTGAIDALMAELPEKVVVLLDEALGDYADTARDASLALLETHPRLIVFRTFSKAWGLAGLRCGYALGGPESPPLLERLEPELGVSELGQAGVLEALRAAPRTVARRVEVVRAERARLVESLRGLGCEVPDTQANVVWIGAPGIDGAELAARLQRSAVIVAGGARFGDPDRVRAAVQTPAASERLLSAVRNAVQA